GALEGAAGCRATAVPLLLTALHSNNEWELPFYTEYPRSSHRRNKPAHAASLVAHAGFGLPKSVRSPPPATSGRQAPPAPCCRTPSFGYPPRPPARAPRPHPPQPPPRSTPAAPPLPPPAPRHPLGYPA